MLLPQSAGFAALKNRLNSVSAIGYLHTPAARGGQSSTPTMPQFDRANRLKTRDEGLVKWPELLDRFRQTQDKARRDSKFADNKENEPARADAVGQGGRKLLPAIDLPHPAAKSGADGSRLPQLTSTSSAPAAAKGDSPHKSKFSTSHFGRLTGKGKPKKPAP